MNANSPPEVLDYHIVPKLVYSEEITNNATFTTSQGGKLKVSQIGNQIYINSAQLLTKDILIANGVIHVLENVLNPENAGPAPNPDKYVTQPVVFSSATKVSSVPFTTAIPCTEDCPVTRGGQTNAGIQPTKTGNGEASGGVTTTSSRAWAARETGFMGSGIGILGAVVGGAALMI
jgi:transforming growth factor-beta-induced protein